MEKPKAGKTGESVIPNKLYFRIGEVSDIVGVKPYVLRYWESEFGDIKPSKSKSGQRLYKRRDVETLVKIKELLYEERFTINGAKKRLKEGGRGETHEVPMKEVRESREPRETAPRQLEVFAAAPADKNDERRPEKGALPRENTKVLIKIRRDLEQLLQVVRQ